MGNEFILSIFDYAIKNNASDIHLSEGNKITYRIDGVLSIAEEFGVIDLQKIKEILIILLKSNKENINKFLINHELDFAYVHTDGVSFRVNAFYRLGKISFVMRRISNKVMTMEELLLPPSTKLFTELKSGLVLITGPTGAGKSTTMVSILEKINNERGEHILTIEDPVEFIFTDNKSIFSQREVGIDTNSFRDALRSSLREDPNIIMIGELRDRETVQSALELAETGHLVISTLHTSSSIQTVNRLISFFPIESQPLVREKLSESLKGVLSQRLVPRIGGGRIGIFELMIVNTGIKNLIRNGNINQMFTYIETGSNYGMIHMQKYADLLRDKGLIKESDYINYFKDQA
ncbi:MAG: PilT/PilU family type 4a pilus ATPase [Candidatus Gracilibacteria bacterium]|nr:PilT/PilU family type 4a pilus ATPase [Candidatus Gracilibacteria bacterium]